MANQQPQAVILQNTLGHLAPFDPNSGQTWSQWLNLFELYCRTNAIPPEPQDQQGNFDQEVNRRRAFFLTAIGVRAYSILHAAALPNDPQVHSIPDLAALLREQFEAPHLTESNRQIFHLRVQKADESVFDFVTALQELAVHCNFQEYYESALRSQTIFGLRHADTKSKLLSNPDLNWDQVRAICFQDDIVRNQIKAMAAAHTNVHRMQSSQSAPRRKQQHHQQEHKKHGASRRSQSSPPHQGKKREESGKKFAPCFFCTRRHDGSNCPAKDWDCNKCGKHGHAAAACESQKRKTTPKKEVPQASSSRSKAAPVHHLSDSNDNNLSELVDELLDL